MNDHDKFLLLWNDDEYSELLKQFLGNKSVISSQAELLGTDFHVHPTGIVVLAELNWNNRRLSDLHGIDVAKRILRAKLKLRSPIVFVSFLSYRQIRIDNKGQEILERRIVGAVGHDFIRLPVHPQQWLDRLAEMQPLNDLQFIDVFNSCCGVKGLIEDVMHQLRNSCHALFNSRENPGRELRTLVDKAFNELTALLGETRDTRDLKTVADEFNFEIATKQKALDFLDQANQDFKGLITEDEVGPPIPGIEQWPQAPWKALILDDEPEGLNPILLALRTRGIDPVVTRSVAEAEARIEEDRNNLITVAISDYRLLEIIDGVTRHQSRQGYDFLFDLAARNRFTRLIAISGLSRKFLLESFRKSQTRVEVYSKNDLTTAGAVNVFADNVLELGAEAHEALCSQPSAAEWNVLKSFYIAYRQAADYSLAEAEICANARRIALQIATLLNNKDEEAFYSPQLPKFENLQKRMKINDANDVKALMKTFKTKLIARRLAIWLYLGAGFDPVKILLALNGELVADRLLHEIKDDLRRKGEEKGSDWAEAIEINAMNELKNRAKQPLKALALSLSDLPDGILVEEKAWLRYDMGLDVDGYEAASPPSWIQTAAEHWCSQYPKHARQLAKHLDFMRQDGNPTISSWKDARRFLLAATDLLETTAEVRDYRRVLDKLEDGLATEATSSIEINEIRRIRQLVDGMQTS